MRFDKRKCSVWCSKNIDFIRTASDQCDSLLGNNSCWLSGQRTVICSTKRLKLHLQHLCLDCMSSNAQSKDFQNKNIKKAKHYHPFFLTADAHCTAVNCINDPISTDRDQTVLVVKLVQLEQLNKNEEKWHPSCLPLYNVRHWSHVNKNKLR